MKFRIGVIVLSLVMLFLFYKVYDLSTSLQKSNEQLTEAVEKLEISEELIKEANKLLKSSEEGIQRKLDSMVKANVTDLWQGAKTINSLKGYDAYKRQNPQDSIHGEDLIKAVDNLLKNKGYVQLIETDGNRLYDEVDLALEGVFVKFRTDKNVRSGAIGIDGCGSPNPTKTGVLIKNKTVRVKDTCHAKGSQSVWAQIEFSQ